MRIAIVSCCAGLAATAVPAFAQDYPSKTIRIVVPVVAGGSPDVLARLIGGKPNGRNGIVKSGIAKWRKVAQALNLKFD